MGCISAPTALLGSGALSAGSSLFGGILGSDASTKAAKIQAQAAERAAALQAAMFQQTQAYLAPYRNVGEAAANLVGAEVLPGGKLDTTTWQPTMAQLEQTPGYQFTLQQGLKAAQNYNTALGLGQSGAAGIAQSKYAEGLASTTYQDQFNNWLKQRTARFNMLGGLTNTGESAAAGTGTAALSAGSTIGNDLTSGAAATAGGVVGSTNAILNALSGGTSSISNIALLYALGGQGMFGNVGNNVSSKILSSDALAAQGGNYGGGY